MSARRTGLAIATMIGSPIWLAAVSAGLYWLAHQRAGTLGFYYPVVFFVNAAVAAAGSAAGISFLPLRRPVLFAVAAAPVAFLNYVVLVIVGAVLFVDLAA